MRRCELKRSEVKRGPVKRNRVALIMVRAALTAVAALAVLLIAVVRTPLPQELLTHEGASSVRVLDREGHLLREVRADDGARARWVTVSDMGLWVPRAILAAEDRRFYAHPGVDLLAAVRALVANLTSGSIVSGASTLTMQLARTLRPHPRTLLGKVAEMTLALRIEQSLSKQQILEQYLNRVSFGPNLRGLAAASFAYFDKPPADLSSAESALLCGLPRGPSLYSLARHPDLTRRRRDRVLSRMAAAGALSRAELRSAMLEPIAPQWQKPRFGAPHFVEALLSGALSAMQPSLAPFLLGNPEVLDTTIDGSLQRETEAATLAACRSLAAHHISAAAVIVLDNATSEVLAYVGSPDFFGEERLGHNDGARALRQPGSTLKPFVYELAFEQLGYSPSTLLDDTELHLPTPEGDYAPRNYDDKFHGPIRLREALANSYNVPAVRTAEALTTEALLLRLRDLGFRSLTRDSAYYGPALALGDGEVSLLELANAYATLARQGKWRSLAFVSGLPAESERVMPSVYARQITDILRDPSARRGSFGSTSALDFTFDVAAKTGTSKGYRDNWTAGFSSEVTVAVWVGNFDGSPMDHVSGITGAAPLFHDVMEAAMRTRPRESLSLGKKNARGAAMHSLVGESMGAVGGRADEELVPRAVCALSGGAAGPACSFHLSEWLTSDQAGRLGACDMHEKVMLDARNGLRAGSGCAKEFTRESVFETYPPQLLSWARAATRPIAPSGFSPWCPQSTPLPESDVAESRRLAILSPLSNQHLVLDPDRPLPLQTLNVRIFVPPPIDEVELLADGEKRTSLHAPFEWEWPLQVGTHTLTARVPAQHQSVSVSVEVREPRLAELP